MLENWGQIFQTQNSVNGIVKLSEYAVNTRWKRVVVSTRGPDEKIPFLGNLNHPFSDTLAG
jgi:hypothetical protein